jgi:hypothetical protein
MNNYPVELRDDLNATLTKSIYLYGIVNIPVLAAQLVARHPGLSLADAERLVLGFAEFHAAPIEFDRSGCDWRRRGPVGRPNNGLMLEIVHEETGLAA